MCLATVVNINQPDSIVLEYVSKIEVNGNQITLTDVMGEQKVVEGTIAMADLTGGRVEIRCNYHLFFAKKQEYSICSKYTVRKVLNRYEIQNI